MSIGRKGGCSCAAWNEVRCVHAHTMCVSVRSTSAQPSDDHSLRVTFQKRHVGTSESITG